MRSSCRRLLSSFVFVSISLGVVAAQAQLWKQFVPGGGGEASGESRDAGAPAPPAGDFGLTQNNGPWLIVAASFNGEGAEEQAQSLAQELRTRHRMSAYVHEMTFKFGSDPGGRGLDEYGGPVKRRFQRGEKVNELAVMVGDFHAIDDPSAQKTLDTIKSLEPQALKVDASNTAQSMAQARSWHDTIRSKLGGSRKRGPMAQAFLTRNPLLPDEYFVPKGVDPFVAKMNEGVDHSLLKCPGKFTIQVATFRGKTILQTNATEEQNSKSFWSRKKVEDDNPLVEAAENAHLLTEELRAHGWEAYEFHNRTESIVTIGGFAQVGQRLPDGRILPLPEVDKIMKTFGAAYDTPADPLSGIGNDAANQRLVDQQEQQLRMQMSSQQSQVVPGLNPKHVKILKGKGKSVKVERIIPIDVYPKAIEVPQQSISSAYAAGG